MTWDAPKHEDIALRMCKWSYQCVTLFPIFVWSVDRSLSIRGNFVEQKEWRKLTENFSSWSSLWIANQFSDEFQMTSPRDPSVSISFSPTQSSSPVSTRLLKKITLANLLIIYCMRHKRRHIKFLFREQSGAVEACWAHNPEVRGSKPRSAKIFWAFKKL